jgi:hypothetical protein
MPSDIIKFRVPAGDKDLFVNCARNAGMTVSDLLRRAGKAAINGRIASRPVLADLVHLRSVANRLDAIAEVAGGGAVEISTEIKAAAQSLRIIARRHLEAGQ